MDFETDRREMVERQLAGRGIRDPRVLEAMGTVPREAFVPERLAEFAYEDSPLPIEADQTISQPYIVAWMAEALELQPGERVLEIGAGSGYAAAVLSRVAGEVYTVERHGDLAERARERCRELGYHNVHVLHGDGTLGWAEHAPYDAIVVAAGGPDVPRPLLDQLAPGGRLVIPVGRDPRLQELVRVRKVNEHTERENLGGVRFVPLVGEAGWHDGTPAVSAAPRPAVAPAAPALLDKDVPSVVHLLHEEAECFEDIATADLGSLSERIGDARVVCLGEATHGTSEFYRFRARLTGELIERKGFRIVAVEADWPDAARIDRYVRHRPVPAVSREHPARARSGEAAEAPAFTRFPTWMWRNREVRDFVEQLREWNDGREPEDRVSFHGLDLYSLYTSLDAVLAYLDRVDPEAAGVARLRYGCLTPWESDPALYGRAAVSGRYRSCEDEVVANLTDLLAHRLDYMERDGERFFDAAQNARVVKNAERYYRVMYYGSRDSWNLRDRHMFETLEGLLEFRSEGDGAGDAKAVVWEHNSHVGDAGATEMGARGEINVGHLARRRFADRAFLVGFGTDHGRVAAASDWGGEMEVKDIRPAHGSSYERLFHDTEIPAGLFHLREPERQEVREELTPARLERAIGVIYRPETELRSHYFQAVLPRQFDEWIWFDKTSAVHPLGGCGVETEGLPETWPFGL